MERQIKKATIIEKSNYKEGFSQSDKPYVRIDVLLELVDGRFTHNLFCTAMGESAKIINEKDEGDIIEFDFYVNSKKHEASGRWFTNAVINFVRK